MKQKLTLSIEPEVVRRVKRLARERKTTVSSLFEDWGARVSDEGSTGKELGDELHGQWKPTRDLDKEDARLDYLLRKHGGSDARAG
jgi:hypothetical protein